MFLLFAVFVTHVVYTSCQINADLGKLEIISDLQPEHCFRQDLNYVEADLVYGLPGCSPFPEDHTQLSVCSQYRKIDLHPQLVYRPTCAKNGDFAPVQCKGERATGRCFCFDSKGERIFGQQWWIQAQNMTCACSSQKANMADPTSPNHVFYNSLHCSRIGNYEPLQCDVISEQCWCSDETTGDLTSPVVPQSHMTRLPCYSLIDVGSQYMRQCESKKYGRDLIAHKFSLHGTAIHYEPFLCDGDGSYGAFAITDGSAYCTWRDNSRIGSWQSGTNHTGITCNCARDSKIFAESEKVLTQKCTGNGNYEEFQTLASHSYCIDKDGYRKSPTTDVPDQTQCAQYISYS